MLFHIHIHFSNPNQHKLLPITEDGIEWQHSKLHLPRKTVYRTANRILEYYGFDFTVKSFGDNSILGNFTPALLLKSIVRRPAAAIEKTHKTA